MEERDLELIQKYQATDETLSELYQEHLHFEQKLEKYNNKAYLSPDEEVERKMLQKKKLLGRDKIEAILRKYRRVEH